MPWLCKVKDLSLYRGMNEMDFCMGVVGVVYLYQSSKSIMIPMYDL